MKNCKVLPLLLVGISASTMGAETSSSIKDSAKPIADKVQRNVRSFADWAKFYSKAGAHNLSDWVQYCYLTAKDKTRAFVDVIQDETAEAFKKLNKEEQKAIHSLNEFYKEMSQATEHQQAILVKNFSEKWKECQRIFTKYTQEKPVVTEKTTVTTKATVPTKPATPQSAFQQSMQNGPTNIQHIQTQLGHKTHAFINWADYYAEACLQDLSDWVDYHRSLTKNDVVVLEKYIIDEKTEDFKNLQKIEQKALKDLNKFYKKMNSANSRQAQDRIVKRFANKWKKYQEIFKKEKVK